jgi:hypothetical protein
MILTLTRQIDDEIGSFGFIQAGGMILCQTVERPWVKHDVYRAGVPFESCVPAGVYGLEPFESEKYGKTYALENAELGVFSHKDQCEQEGDRYGILIHAGNWPSDLQGCIAPGLGRVKWEDSWMVSKSRDALTDLLDVLAHDEVNTLEIKYV